MTNTRSRAALETRYLALGDRVESIVAALARSDGDAKDEQLFTELAEVTGELAKLTRQVHHGGTDAVQIGADLDAARLATLLADVAHARVHGAARTTGLVAELEDSAYTRAVLDGMASQDDQPGWVLAHRLNVVIDAALTRGLHTRLAERIAYAASSRPDGENAAEYEAAA